VSGDATPRLRFQALYEANYSAILGYARRRAPRDEAADVVADTFLVAWRRISDVPEGDEARLWLYGTARRVLANRARSERRRNRIGAQLAAQTLLPAQGDPPETDVVARAFERLRPEERELLALVAWEACRRPRRLGSSGARRTPSASGSIARGGSSRGSWRRSALRGPSQWV